jgi:hypothetical protein
MVLTRGEIHSKNGGMRWVCVLCTIPINPKLYKKSLLMILKKDIGGIAGET